MRPQSQFLSRNLATPRTLLRNPQPSFPRTFTTAPVLAARNPLQRRRGGDLGSHLPKHVIPQGADIPPYPYGENLLFKQSNKGLYGGQMIQFGNNVSEETETKTRRHWKPNVLEKALYSVALKKRIKLRITSKVLKTMDREGGLDNYLLRQSEHRIKELGPLGWALRWTLMQRPEVIEQMRAEAATLGIDQESIDRQWPAVEKFPSAAVSSDPSVSPEIFAQEYRNAQKAARRYVKKGWVDNHDDGLKLAFIRARERKEDSASSAARFTERLQNMFPGKTTKQAREAYKQWKAEQIKAAGSYTAWRTSQMSPDEAAQYIEVVEKKSIPADSEAYLANKRAEVSSQFLDAENASRNPNLSPEDRAFLNDAMLAAEAAIDAHELGGGADAFVEWRMKHQELAKDGIAEEEEPEDAWADVVQKQTL